MTDDIWDLWIDIGGESWTMTSVGSRGFASVRTMR